MSSQDISNENVEKIAALFPNCVTETAQGKAIDFDLLKQELNNEVIEGNTRKYGVYKSIEEHNLQSTNNSLSKIKITNTESLWKLAMKTIDFKIFTQPIP